MMEDEERNRKVLEGKQKLAAFRKKQASKNRKKKTKTVNDDSESEVSSVIDMADLGSLSDVSADSQNGSSVSSETEEGMSSRSFQTSQRELKRSHERVTELEETLLGKEALLDSLIQENEQLKDDLSAARTHGVKVTERGVEGSLEIPSLGMPIESVEECQKKIALCQSAIQQRDEVIRQLSENLRATTENRDSLQLEYQAQAQQLTAQVHLLQDQLSQTSVWLQQHAGEHGISTQALMEAKNELLALQQVNKEKDSQIWQLQAAMTERDQTITQLVEKFNSSAEKFEKMKKAYIHLQQGSMVLQQEKSHSSPTKLQFELTSLKQSYNELLHKLALTTEINIKYEVLQKENVSLKVLNDELVKKEHGSSTVVKQLMENIEQQKKEPPASPSATSSDLELATLRAQLDETHGEQLVLMKEQLQDQHKLEVDRLHRELGGVKENRDKLSTQVTEWQKMYMTLSQTGASGADLSLEIHALRTENSMYKDHISDLTSQIEALKQETRQLKEQPVTGSDSGINLNNSNNELANQCAEYKKQVQDLTTELRNLHSERKDVLKELQDAQEQVFELDKLQGKILTYESMISTLEEKLKIVAKERQDSINEMNSLKVALNTIQDKASLLTTHLEDLQDSLESTQSQLKNMEIERDSIKTKFIETESLLAAERAQLKQTESHFTETENELLRTRSAGLRVESELSGARQEVESLREAHSRDMQVVQGQFEMRLKMELEERNIQLQETKLQVETLQAAASSGSGGSKVVEEIQALQTKFQEENDRIKHEYTQYIQQMQTSYEAQMKSATEQWQSAHATQIKSLQEQYTAAQQAQLLELQENMNKTHQTQIHSLKEQYEGEIQRISNEKSHEYERKIVESEEVHAKKLENIVAQLTEKHHSDILQLQKEHSISPGANNLVLSPTNIGLIEDHHSTHTFQQTDNSNLLSPSQLPNITIEQSSCDNLQSDSTSTRATEELPDTVIYHEEDGKTTRVVQSRTVKSTRVIKSRILLSSAEAAAMAGGSSRQTLHAISDANTNTVLESPSETIHTDGEVRELVGRISQLEYENRHLEIENENLRTGLKANVGATDVKSAPVDATDAVFHDNSIKGVPIPSMTSITSIGSEYEEHYTSATDLTANITDELYLSAREPGSPKQSTPVSVTTTEKIKQLQNEKSQLQTQTQELVNEKEELGIQLEAVRQEMSDISDRCSTQGIDNDRLKTENYRLTAEMELTNEVTISELRQKMKELEMEKSSLKTMIFYKDLELSKFQGEKEESAGESSSADDSLQTSLEKEEHSGHRDTVGVADQGQLEEKAYDDRYETENKDIDTDSLNEDTKHKESDTVSRLKGEVAHLTSTNEMLLTQLSAAEDKIEEMSVQIDAQQADYERLKMEMAGEDFEIERLTRKKNESIENITERTTTVEEVNIISLQEQVKKLEKEKQDLSSQIDNLEIDIGELRAAVETRDLEIAELQKEAVDMEVEYQQQLKAAPQSPDTNTLLQEAVIIKAESNAASQTSAPPPRQLSVEDSINLQWKLDQISEENSKLEKQSHKLGENNDRLEKEIASVRNEYAELKAQYCELEDNLSRKEELFSSQATDVEVCIGNLSSQIAQLEKENKQLKEVETEQTSKLDEKITQYEKQISELKATIQKFECESREWMDKVKSSESKRLSLADELEQAQNVELELLSKVSELESKHGEVNTKLIHAHSELSEVGGKLTQIEEEKGKLREEYSVLQAENRRLCAELDNGRAELSGFKQKLELLESGESGLSEKAGELQSQLNQSKCDFKQAENLKAELEESLKNYDGKVLELRKHLEQSESKCGELEERLKEENLKYVDASNKLDEINKKLVITCEKLATKENQSKELSNKLNNEEERTSSLTIQCAELSQEKKDLTEILNHSKEELANVKVDIKQLKSSSQEGNKLHTQQMAQLKEDHTKVLSHYESVIEAVTSEKGDFMSEFEQMREMVEEKQALIVQMQEETATLRIGNESSTLEHEKEVERLMNQINELETGKMDASEKLAGVQSDFDNTTEAVKSLTIEQGSLNDELKKSLEEKEVLSLELAEKLEQIQTLGGKVTALETLTGELQKKDEEYKTIVSETIEKVEHFSGLLQEKEHAIQNLNEKNKEILESKEESNNKLKEEAETREKLSEAREKLSEETEGLKVEVNDLKENLKSATETVVQLKSALEEAEKQEKTSARAEEVLKNQMDNSQKQVENLKRLNEKLLERVKTSQQNTKALQDKLETTKTEVEKLQNEKEEIEKLKNSKEEHCIDLKSSLSELEAKLSKERNGNEAAKQEGTDKLTALKTEKLELEKCKVNLEGKIVNLEDQLNKITVEKTGLDTTIKTIQDDCEELRKTVDELKVENQSLKVNENEFKRDSKIQVEKLRQQASGITEEKDSAIKRLGEECVSYKNKLEQNAKLLADSQTRTVLLESDIQILNRTIVEKSDFIKGIEFSLECKTNENVELCSIIDKQEGNFTEKGNQIQALSADIERTKHENDNISRQLSEMKSRLETSEQALVNSRNGIQGLEEQLKNSQEEKLGMDNVIVHLKETIEGLKLGSGELGETLQRISREKEGLSAELLKANQEKENLTSEFEEVRTECTGLKSEKNELNVKIKDLTSGNDSLKQEVDNLKLQEEKLNKLFTDTQERLQAGKAEMEKQMTKQQELELRIRELEKEKSEFQEQLNTGKSEIEKQMTKQQELELSICELGKDKSELQSQIQGLGEQLKNSQEEKLVMDNQIVHLKETVEGLKLGSGELGETLQRISREKEGLSAELLKVNQEKEKFASEFEKVNTECTDLKSEKNELNVKLKDLTSGNDSLKQEVENLQLEEKKLNKLVTDTQEQLNAGKAEIEKLLLNKTDLEKEIEQLSSTVSESRNKIEKFKTDNEKQKTDCLAFTSEKEHLQSEIEELRKEITQMGNEFEAVNLSKLENEQQMTLKQQELELSIGELGKEKSELHSKIQELTTTIEEINSNFVLEKQENLTKINCIEEEKLQLKNHFESSMKELSDKNEVFRNENDSLKVEIEQMGNDRKAVVEALNADVKKIQDENSGLKNDNTIICETISSLGEQLRQVNNENEALNFSITELKSNIESINSTLTSEKSDLSKEMSEFKSQIQCLSKDKEDLSENLSKMSEKNVCAAKENAELSKEVSDLKSQKESLSNDNSDLKHSLDKSEEQRSFAEKEVERVESELSGVQESLERLLQENETVSADYDEQMIKNKSLQEDVKNKDIKIERLETEKEEYLREMPLVKEEYRKAIDEIKNEVEKISERNAHLNSEMDLMRSENLSLQTEKQHDKEADKAVIVDLQERLQDVNEEKQAAQEECDTTLDELKNLQKLHSDAIGEFQKQIKNLYNLAERLEKENTKLQDRVVETITESDALKEKLEGIQSEYEQIFAELQQKLTELQQKESDTENLHSKLREMEGENDQLRIKLDESQADYNGHIKQMQDDIERLSRKPSEEAVSPDSVDSVEVCESEPVNLPTAEAQKQQSINLADQQSKVHSLEQEISKYQEERQLMEASIENVKFERDRLKQRVTDLEQSIQDIEDGDSKNISMRYEQEVSTLKRSLETVMGEREAMKETFEEDLGRLSKQVEDKEIECVELEQEVQGLQRRASLPHGFHHSTPRLAEKRLAVDDAVGPISEIKPVHFAGLGLVSDSIRLEIEEEQQQGQAHSTSDSTELSPSGAQQEFASSEGTGAKITNAAAFGGFGIFSDSCKLQSADLDSIAHQPPPAQGLASDCLPLEGGRRPFPGLAADGRQAGAGVVSQAGSIEDIIQRYEQKLAAVREQHDIELKVAEYNASETYNLQLRQLKVHVHYEVEEEYKNKMQELENQYEQKMKTLKKELESNFVVELQKARRELRRSVSEVSDDSTGQVDNEGVILRRQLERLEEGKIELLEAIDAHTNREEELQEEVLNLSQARDHLSQENTRLAKQLSLYTDNATVESTSEFNKDEWRVSYDSVLKKETAESVKPSEDMKNLSEKPSQAPSNSDLNDIGDGSLPTSQEIPSSSVSEVLYGSAGGLQLDDGDNEEIRNQLDALQSENESLKVNLQDKSLGLDESMREELMDMQCKYQMILQEKGNLLRHFHRFGIDPSMLAMDFDFHELEDKSPQRPRSSTQDSAMTEDSLTDHTPSLEEETPSLTERTPSLEEDFIDWKLKYEVVEKENELLVSRLDSSQADSLVGSASRLNRSPPSHITRCEFRSRHSALVEQNEMLRAHLGSRGYYMDRSLEGDTLDMHFQLQTLASENQQLKQHLQEYDETGQLENHNAQVPTCLEGSKPRTSSTVSTDINWRLMFENLCKENADLKSQLGKLQANATQVSDVTVSSEVDVTSAIKSAIEDDTSLTRSQIQTVEQEGSKSPALTISVVQEGSQTETPETKDDSTDDLNESYQQLQQDHDKLKKELNQSKDKGKKDLLKMKAKYVAGSKELEKLKKQLASYEKQLQEQQDTQDTSRALSVASMSTSTSSSVPEDSGFVMISETTVHSTQSSQALVTESDSTASYYAGGSASTVLVSARDDADADLQSRLDELSHAQNQLVADKQQMADELQQMQVTTTSTNTDPQRESDDKYIKLREEFNDLQSQKNELMKEAEELRCEVEFLRETATGKSDVVHRQEDKYSSLVKEHKNVKAQMADSQKKLERFESVKIENRELKQGLENMDRLRTECEGLRNQLEEVRQWNSAELQQLEVRCESLAAERGDLISRLQVTISERDQVKSEFTLQRNESREKLKCVQSDVQRIQVEKRESCDRLQMLEEQLKVTEARNTDLQLQVENYSEQQIDSLRSEVGFHPIKDDDDIVDGYNNTVEKVLVTDATNQDSNIKLNTNLVKQTASDMVDSDGDTVLQDMEELQEQYQIILGENSRLMHDLEDMENELADAKYQIAVYENKTAQESIELEGEKGGMSQQKNHHLPEIDADTSKGDTSFGMSDVVRVSITEEVGEDSDMGRVVDVQKIHPTGVFTPDTSLREDDGSSSESKKLAQGKHGQRKESVERNSTKSDGGAKSGKTGVKKSTPTSKSSTVRGKDSKVENKTTQKLPPVQKADVRSKTGKLTKAISEAELSADLLKKERDKLARENRQLSERLNQMSRGSTEASNYRIKFERLNKENKELQAKYEREVVKVSAVIPKKRVSMGDNEEVKKLKQEKLKLDREMKAVKADVSLKEKENKELLKLIHQSGQNQAQGGRSLDQGLDHWSLNPSGLVQNQSGLGLEDVDDMQLRIQYEILLTEKEQMCMQFEEERTKLMDSLEEVKHKTNLLELERNAAVDFDYTLPINPEDVVRLRRHAEEVERNCRALVEEKTELMQEIDSLKQEKQGTRANTHSEKIELQQRINDLNSKIEVLETHGSDLKSQLQLLKIEKMEIKSELEERLKQLEIQNREQLAVIEATKISGFATTTDTVTTSIDQHEMLSPMSIQIYPTATLSQYTHVPSTVSSGSSPSRMSIHSPASQISLHSGFNLESQLLSMSELKMQYEILLEEKKDICGKLENEIKTVNQLRNNIDDLNDTLRDYESNKIQYELLMDEKNELCLVLDKEQNKSKELKERVRSATEQLLEVQRNNQVLSSRCESLRLDLSHEAIDEEEDCFETEGESEEREKKKTMENKVKELSVQLEKVEQDLEFTKEELEASRQLQTDDENVEDLSVKQLKEELKSERRRLKSVKDEIEDFHFKCDELDTQLETLQQDNESLNSEVCSLKLNIEELTEANCQLVNENKKLKVDLGDKERDLADKMNELQEALDDCLSGKQALWSQIGELKATVRQYEASDNSTKTKETENKKKNKDDQKDDESQKFNDDLLKLRTELDHLTFENEEMEKRYGEAKSELDSVNAKKDTIQSELKVVSEEKQAIEKDCASVQMQISQVTSTVTTLMSDNDTLRGENETLKKTVVTLQGQAHDISENIVQIYSEYEKLQASREQSEREIVSLTNTKQSLQEEAEQERNSKLELVASIESLKLQIEGYDERQGQLEKENCDIIHEFELLSEEKQKWNDQVNDLVKEKEEFAKNLLETSISVVKKDQELDAKGVKIKEFESINDSLKKELEIIRNDFDEVRKKLSDCETCLNNANEKVNQLQGENKKLFEKGSILENGTKRDTLELEKHLLELQYEKETYNSEKIILKEQNVRLGKENETLKNSCSDYEKMKEKLELTNMELTQQLDESMAERNLLISQIDSASTELLNVIDELKSLQDQNLNKKRQIEELEAGKLILEEAVKVATDRFEECKVDKVTSDIMLKEVKEELNQIRADYDMVVKEKESLQSIAADTEVKNSELQTEMSTLERGNRKHEEELTLKLNQLEGQLRRKDDENEQLQSKISQIDSNDTAGVDTPTSSTPTQSSKLLDVKAFNPSNDQCDDELNISTNSSLKDNCDECKKLQASMYRLHKEFIDVSEKYQQSRIPPDADRTGSDTVDIAADLNISDLQEENALLFKQKNDLENEFMTLRADKEDVINKMELADLEYKAELDVLKERVGDYQSLCDTVTAAKEKLEVEIVRERNDFEASLSKLRLQKLEKTVEDEDRIDEIVKEIAESERNASELRDDLRAVEEEKGLLQLKVGHLMRECKLLERHIKDLEKEVETQAFQIQEAMHEHKETIRMLAEMRLEQEVGKKEQKGEFIRIDGELKRLETEINTTKSNTPLSMSVVSGPAMMEAVRYSRAESVSSYNEEMMIRSDVGSLDPTDGERALSMKHFQMIEELNRLHRNLQESKEVRETLSKENKSLRESLERERERNHGNEHEDEGNLFMDSVIEMQRSSSKSRHSSGTPNNNNSRRGSIDYMDISAEMLGLKERVIILQTNNRKLIHENEMLRLQLTQQELLFEEFKKNVRGGKVGDIERVLNQQILLLKQQRDELLLKIEEMKLTGVKYNDVLEEKCKLEDSLRREKEMVRQRTHEKEKLEIELLRERLSLERQFKEQHRLEELIKHKGMLEQELYRQKEQLEEELSQAESKFRENGHVVADNDQIQNRESQVASRLNGDVRIQSSPASATEKQIQAEIKRVSGEIQQKSKTVQAPVKSRSSLPERGYKSTSSSHRRTRTTSSGGSSLVSGTSGRSGTSSRKLKLECGCVAELDTMKMYAQCHYHIAVEKLRTDLRRVENKRTSRRK